MYKEWSSLRKFPILNKTGMRFKFLQFSFLWLAIRRPVSKAYPNFEFLNTAKGAIWINFNFWLRFQLKFIHSRYWAASPLIRAVALVNLDETYKSDQFRISADKEKEIERLAEKYCATFSIITRSQFRNWIIRNYLLATAFSEFDVNPTSDSEYLVEIGPGLGAMISLTLESNCKEVYSIDTYEMQSTFSALVDTFPTEFSRLKQIAANDPRNVRPFHIPNTGITVLAFWSFTELTEKERLDYIDVFNSAKTIIIGSNEEFEGINNYKYIEGLAISLGMSLYWKGMSEIFTTEIPEYQKNHRVYLLRRNQ
jgi:hypothetical protein